MTGASVINVCGVTTSELLASHHYVRSDDGCTIAVSGITVCSDDWDIQHQLLVPSDDWGSITT